MVCLVVDCVFSALIGGFCIVSFEWGGALCGKIVLHLS